MHQISYLVPATSFIVLPMFWHTAIAVFRMNVLDGGTNSGCIVANFLLTHGVGIESCGLMTRYSFGDSC
jgi:hypothetical protein